MVMVSTGELRRYQDSYPNNGCEHCEGVDSQLRDSSSDSILRLSCVTAFERAKEAWFQYVH